MGTGAKRACPFQSILLPCLCHPSNLFLLIDEDGGDGCINKLEVDVAGTTGVQWNPQQLLKKRKEGRKGRRDEGDEGTKGRRDEGDVHHLN